MQMAAICDWGFQVRIVYILLALKLKPCLFCWKHEIWLISHSHQEWTCIVLPLMHIGYGLIWVVQILSQFRVSTSKLKLCRGRHSEIVILPWFIIDAIRSRCRAIWQSMYFLSKLKKCHVWVEVPCASIRYLFWMLLLALLEAEMRLINWL